MAKDENDVQVSFYLDKDLREELRNIAKKKDLNFSQVLRRACVEYADNQGNKGDNENMNK